MLKEELRQKIDKLRLDLDEALKFDYNNKEKVKHIQEVLDKLIQEYDNFQN